MLTSRPVEASCASRKQLALAIAFALGLGVATPALAQEADAFRIPPAGPAIDAVPQPETAEDRQRAAAHEAAWVARCKPTTVLDKFGVERYVYAAPGCEFGRSR